MKVSIIIPVYNVEFYVKRCIDSVANQTMVDGVECILVDDCGTDKSIVLVEEFVKHYSGKIVFKIIHHTENRGLSAARNTGINAAKGKYVYFLDSDDEITPDCIEKLFFLANRYDSDFVQGCFIADVPMLSSFWKVMPEVTNNIRYIKRTMLDYDRYPVMAQNRLVLRNLIVENSLFFKESIIHEDNHWTFFLAKYIKKLVICNSPTYLYRSTPGSIMHSINIQKEVSAFACILEDFCNNIDLCEKGAQKKLIFLNLLTLFEKNYYESYDKAKSLLSMFMEHNTFPEKIVLYCCFNINIGFYLKCKMINLLQRMYLS